MFVCPDCGACFEELGFCANDGTRLMSNADDALIGTSIGPYKVARLLGVGGMGRVYKGVNPAISSRVAIKVLSHDCASSSVVVERFFAEARAVNVIRHENIVNVLDLATLPDGRPYIVMEYLDGSALSSLMERGPRLPLGSFIRIVTEVLDALEAAHAKSIVHRDLKPDNIFVSPNGHAKVLDFGIAKLMPEHSGRSGPTRDGSLLGTPHYMAPEQALARPVDARTDIYAVGVILFEGTTGSRLFSAESLFDLLRQHVEEPPRSPRSLRSEIPLELETTILKALAKDPNHRHQSVRELAEELSHATRSLPAEAWTALGSGLSSKLSLPTPMTGTGPTQLAPSGSYEAKGDKQASFAPRHHSASMPTPLHQEAPPPQGHGSGGQGRLIVVALLALVGLGVAVALGIQDDQAPEALASLDGNDASMMQLDGPSEAAHNEIADATPLGSPDGNSYVNEGANPAKVRPTLKSTNTKTTPAQGAPDAGQPRLARAEVDAGASSANTVAPPDISHRNSKTPSPEAFDIAGYIPTAYKKARQVFSDAELVRIDADGVLPNGEANLRLDSSYSVLYRFQSKSRSARPKDLPLGVDFKPTCLYYVYVSADQVDTYGLQGWKCDMEYAGRPRCSAKEIWQRAIAKGAPAANVVAGLSYSGHAGKGRWSFSIKDTKFSWWIPDDC